MKTYGHLLTVPDLRASPDAVLGLPPHVTPSTGVYGAEVASRNFLRYLFKYADYDEYHFFLPRAYLDLHPELATEVSGTFFEDPRVKFQPVEEFAACALENQYQVLHHCEGPNMANCVAFRNRVSPFNIPVTSVTYSISYESMLQELAFIMLAAPRPFDSIVCTGATARNIMRRLLKHIESSSLRDGGRRLRYKARLDDIPLGVDTSEYRTREKARVRHHLALPSGRVLLLWYGRFSPYDKADLAPLLIAFKMALSKLPGKQVTLLLVGEDTRHAYSENVKHLAGELGLLKHLLIRTNPSRALGAMYFAAADVFICPADNIQETFGQTVIEAMSSGLPVICSDWDGFRHTVIHQQTGLRIPTYWAECDSQLCDFASMNHWRYDHLYLSQSIGVDIPLMAEAIQLLAGSRERRTTMGIQARRHALAHFDWSLIIQRYLDLWKELQGMAGRSRKTSGKESLWSRLPYFRTFESYATLTLEKGMSVRANRSPGLLPPWDPLLSKYQELRSVFSAALAETILQEASNPIPVGRLETVCRAQSQCSVELVRWHILRLLKYSYLLIDGSIPEPLSTERASRRSRGARKDQ